MKEELGLIEDKKQPLDAAITTFAAFNLVGVIPLIPFVFTFQVLKFQQSMHLCIQ